MQSVDIALLAQCLFRTFHTVPKILKLFENRPPVVAPTGLVLTDAKFEHPFLDLAWVLAQF